MICIRKLGMIIGGIITYLCVSSSVGAVTDAHSGYCDDIESTAAALKCIIDHKENAEKELQKAFEFIHKDSPEIQREYFLDAHKNWITYRNSQCSWEAKTSQPALERLTELSCVTKLTETRAVRLLKNTESQNHPEKVSEFGSFPKWLNALYKKHPDVIWDVKSQETYDLTCDAYEEHIIQGVSFQESNAKTGQYDLKMYIAITDGDETGKPISTILDFPAMQGEMCRYALEENLQEKEICPQKIYFSAPQKNCERVSLSFDEIRRYSLKKAVND